MNKKIDELLHLEIKKENVLEVEKKVKEFVKELYQNMKTLPLEEKKTFGAEVNDFKLKMEEKIASVKQNMQKTNEKDSIDLTLSKPSLRYGAMHPLNKIYKRFEEYYKANGYNIVSGPEIELDKYNCEMLNIPEHHPARGMQDTFYLELPNKILRSHTSAVQT
jgi:phenylalanyl-tRNA synthetase alpha chain